MNAWLEHEDNYIRSYYQTKTDKQLAEYLKRTKEAVKSHRQSIGCLKNSVNITKQWKQHEIKYLINNYPTKTVNHIAKYLNRTPGGVGAQIWKQKLTTKRHGQTDTRLYRCWFAMKNRCQNPNASRYSSYGGNGITVCDQWQDFRNFYKWAQTHEYSDKLVLDRIDNGGNYSPNNCRWTTYAVSNRNTTRSVVNATEVLQIHFFHYYGIYTKKQLQIKYGYKQEKAIASILSGYSWPDVYDLFHDNILINLEKITDGV